MKSETIRKLNGYRRAKRKFVTARLELEECETMINNLSVDYSKEKVRSHHEADKLADMIDRLNILRNEYIKRAEIATKEMEAVRDLIEGVQDDMYYEILSRRYIVCQHWEDIAEAKGYSQQRIFQLHRQAAREVEKIIRGENDGEKEK